MNNQHADIDVGKPNFQPMPKRFMVWDKGNQKFMYFIDDDGYERFMVDISELYVLIEEYGYSYEDVVIVQSTNLFDKDGKEIFEGSVVDYNDDGSMLGVVVDEDGEWCLNDKNSNRMFLKGAPHQKLVGHILSNPELLRRNNYDDN